MTVPATYEDEPRHRAPWWLGIRLGLSTLVIGLLPAVALLSLFAIALISEKGGTISGEGIGVLGAIGAMLMIVAALFVAPVLGVWALAKNRVLGKVLGAIGLALVVLDFIWIVAVVISNATD